jgi:hypothetical protein
MNFDRRHFLKTAGTAAVSAVAGGILRPIPLLGETGDDSRSRHPRVAIFMEDGFTQTDGFDLTREQLTAALHDWDVTVLDAAGLNASLTKDKFDCLVLPYGSAFPASAFTSIVKYLSAGGNFVNLGGVPFSIPVVRSGLTHRAEVSQTEYHKRLGITQAFPIDTSRITSWAPHSSVGGTDSLTTDFTATTIFGFYVRFTDTKDFPAEDGSSGVRDAVMLPLVTGIDSQKRRIGVPFLLIDRINGDFAGGRWILAPFSGTINNGTVRRLVDLAMAGAMELTARPSFSSYREGEVPTVTVQFTCPGGLSERLMKSGRVEVVDEKGKSYGSAKLQFTGAGTVVSAVAEAVTGKGRSLAPGLYTVRTEAEITPSAGGHSITLNHATGFWVYDRDLLGRGKPLTIRGAGFERDGKPYQVTGTTYMTTDVHRKFLLEPNVHLWNRDFREMKDAGINLVRTGIWTGWKLYMPEPGTLNEAALRSLDAFLLTARKYDIPVIFTLFAFLPETWGGENPYLDPRSIGAQRTFISLIAQRYGMMNSIIWDLINEPSFCSAQQLWKCRPNYDRFEDAAWTAWLKQRYPAASEQEWADNLHEMYRSASDETLGLPPLEEFDDVNIFNGYRPLRVIDYRLFAQEKFRDWAAEMARAIRAAGGAHQLITVGQDEGGTGDRPNPHFYAPAVDFTCVHNWWFNDDLVWDSVVTGVPGKPNLVEETGIMFYETMEGKPWRTESDAALLLKRKLAVALGTGSAGFVEWLWNTNPYMKSDNEAAIGLLRADGTIKPELDALEEIVRFVSAGHEWMRGKGEEPVLMVIPHSEMFSPRNLATASTQRCVRLMTGGIHLPLRSVSEYCIDRLTIPPALIIVPSPLFIERKALDRLLQLAEQGSTVLISGPIEGDAHLLPIAGIPEMRSAVVPVNSVEKFSLDSHDYLLSFRGDKLQRVRKSVGLGGVGSAVVNVSRGKGRIIWSPLPVELAEETEPAAALYSFAVSQAGVKAVFTLKEGDEGCIILPVVYAEAVLYAVIPQSDRSATVTIQHAAGGTPIEVRIEAGHPVLLLVHRTTGHIVARSR